MTIFAHNISITILNGLCTILSLQYFNLCSFYFNSKLILVFDYYLCKLYGLVGSGSFEDLRRLSDISDIWRLKSRKYVSLKSQR